MRANRQAKTVVSGSDRVTFGLVFVIWLLLIAFVGKISEMVDPYLGTHLLLTFALQPT